MPRGGTNYIPRPDGNFDGWANHYNEAVHKFYEAQGLDVSELKPLETASAACAGQSARSAESINGDTESSLTTSPVPMRRFRRGSPTS